MQTARCLVLYRDNLGQTVLYRAASANLWNINHLFANLFGNDVKAPKRKYFIPFWIADSMTVPRPVGPYINSVASFVCTTCRNVFAHAERKATGSASVLHHLTPQNDESRVAPWDENFVPDHERRVWTCLGEMFHTRQKVPTKVMVFAGDNYHHSKWDQSMMTKFRLIEKDSVIWMCEVTSDSDQGLNSFRLPFRLKWNRVMW
jgi:hypothetical protein